MSHGLVVLSAAMGVAATLATAVPAAAKSVPSTWSDTSYHTARVDGLNIFYREAGPKSAPTILLLHGFPASSREFATLIPLLADRYHLVAPDYPGFFNSDSPPASQFAYTFDHLSQVILDFTDQLALRDYVLFMNDYGGPVGFRLALWRPERVRAMVVQNAVAHEAGLGPLWDARKAFWKDRAAHEAALRANFTSLEATRNRHVGSSPHPERYDPSVWRDEYAFLSSPGQSEIQLDLFYDYQTNVASYPRWQAWLRVRKPPMLVVWGKYDPSFALPGATAYKDDVPDAEVHLLEAGHFALEEANDQVAGLVRDFLRRQGID